MGIYVLNTMFGKDIHMTCQNCKQLVSIIITLRIINCLIWFPPKNGEYG